MKAFNLLVAAVVVTSSLPAFAVVQSKSFSLRASGFALNIGDDFNVLLPSPAFPSVEFDFNLVIDDELSYLAQSNELNVTNLSIVPTVDPSPLDVNITKPLEFNFFDSFGTDLLYISTDAAQSFTFGQATCFTNRPNSFCVGIQNPFSATPNSSFILYTDANGSQFLPSKSAVVTLQVSAKPACWS